MSTQDSRPGAALTKDLQGFIDRTHAWLGELQAAKDRLQQLLGDPAGELSLSEFLARDSGVRPGQTYRPMFEGPRCPSLLENCTSQEQVVEFLARANNGVANLKDAVQVIRELGLSKASTDRGLRRNLGTRLVDSGRWEKVGPSLYRLLAWEPESDDAEVPSASGETYGSSAPDSEPAGPGETDTRTSKQMGTLNRSAGVREQSEEPLIPSSIMTDTS